MKKLIFSLSIILIPMNCFSISLDELIDLTCLKLGMEKRIESYNDSEDISDDDESDKIAMEALLVEINAEITAFDKSLTREKTIELKTETLTKISEIEKQKKDCEKQAEEYGIEKQDAINDFNDELKDLDSILTFFEAKLEELSSDDRRPYAYAYADHIVNAVFYWLQRRYEIQRYQKKLHETSQKQLEDHISRLYSLAKKRAFDEMNAAESELRGLKNKINCHSESVKTRIVDASRKLDIAKARFAAVSSRGHKKRSSKTISTVSRSRIKLDSIRLHKRLGSVAMGQLALARETKKSALMYR